jgi:Icc-related predicted phosphoesterase
MNAFDNYRCYEQLYKEYADKSNVKSVISKMMSYYASAKSGIRIYSGELWPFAADLDVTNQFINIIKNNPNIDLTIVCGDVIACRYLNDDSNTLYNPLLNHIEKGDINATVYYNRFSLEEQIDDKYFHSIIIDNGKHIMMETPHDYDAHTNRFKESQMRRMFIDNNIDLADSLNDYYNEYIIINDLEKVTNFDAINWKLYHYNELKGMTEANVNIESTYPSIFTSA